jgi:hypothetical protein
MKTGFFFFVAGVFFVYFSIKDISNAKKVAEDRLKGLGRDSWRPFLFSRRFYKWHSPEWTYYDVLLGGVVALLGGLVLIALSLGAALSH